MGFTILILQLYDLIQIRLGALRRQRTKARRACRADDEKVPLLPERDSD